MKLKDDLICGQRLRDFPVHEDYRVSGTSNLVVGACEYYLDL